MAVEFDIQDNGTRMWLESESNVVERLEDLNGQYNEFGGGITGVNALYYLTNEYNGVWYHAGGRKVGNRYVYDPAKTDPGKFGDNARQSEPVELGRGLTIDMDPTMSVHFINWDGHVELYGGDDYRDIRFGSHGALVQTREPIICLKDLRGEERRRISVVRCTGRVIAAD